MEGNFFSWKFKFFHPFCRTNKVIVGDKGSIKKDILIYLNGVVFEREFYHWDEMNGYELMIGKKMVKSQKLYGKYLKLKITTLTLMYSLIKLIR